MKAEQLLDEANVEDELMVEKKKKNKLEEQEEETYEQEDEDKEENEDEEGDEGHSLKSITNATLDQELQRAIHVAAQGRNVYHIQVSCYLSGVLVDVSFFPAILSLLVL